MKVFFWLSLLGAIFIGMISALGESTFLGFLKVYPPVCTGYFSSGTGFAGISATLILLTLKASGLQDS